jgi:hypothetical protein
LLLGADRKLVDACLHDVGTVFVEKLGEPVLTRAQRRGLGMHITFDVFGDAAVGLKDGDDVGVELVIPE